MNMELTQKQIELFEVLKGMGGVRERIMLYQNIFWNNVKITENDKIGYEGIFENSALLLKVFKYVLKEKMIIDCYEISLLAQTSLLVYSRQESDFIKKYNEILKVNSPHLKEMLSIVN
ncbi:hypothetical protein [Clostridium sp.]|uniref:hypothetical protein n=1 Tax=Clostridium sp. TaxID=1506 RepID=UPI003F4BF3D4